MRLAPEARSRLFSPDDSAHVKKMEISNLLPCEYEAFCNVLRGRNSTFAGSDPSYNNIIETLVFTDFNDPALFQYAMQHMKMAEFSSSVSYIIFRDATFLNMNKKTGEDLAVFLHQFPCLKHVEFDDSIDLRPIRFRVDQFNMDECVIQFWIGCFTRMFLPNVSVLILDSPKSYLDGRVAAAILTMFKSSFLPSLTTLTFIWARELIFRSAMQHTPMAPASSTFKEATVATQFASTISAFWSELFQCTPRLYELEIASWMDKSQPGSSDCESTCELRFQALRVSPTAGKIPLFIYKLCFGISTLYNAGQDDDLDSASLRPDEKKMALGRIKYKDFTDVCSEFRVELCVSSFSRCFHLYSPIHESSPVMPSQLAVAFQHTLSEPVASWSDQACQNVAARLNEMVPQRTTSRCESVLFQWPASMEFAEFHDAGQGFYCTDVWRGCDISDCDSGCDCGCESEIEGGNEQNEDVMQV